MPTGGRRLRQTRVPVVQLLYFWIQCDNLWHRDHRLQRTGGRFLLCLLFIYRRSIMNHARVGCYRRRAAVLAGATKAVHPPSELGRCTSVGWLVGGWSCLFFSRSQPILMLCAGGPWVHSRWTRQLESQDTLGAGDMLIAQTNKHWQNSGGFLK